MRNRTSELSPSLLFLIGATVTAEAPLASHAWAQAGFYVTPSVSVTESYDDNVFSTPQDPAEPAPGPPVPGEPTPVPVERNRRTKTDDFIFSANPGLEAGYQSDPFTLLVGYRFGAEVYAERSELNAAPARQQLTLRGTYLPDPLLTLALIGGYIESKFARELNTPAVSAQTGLPVTGLDRTRARAETYFASPSVTYDLNPLTTANVGYGYARTHQVGAPSSETHEGKFSLTRKLTERDNVDLNYSYRHFLFDEVTTITSPAPEPTPQDPSATPTPVPTPARRTRSSQEDSHAVTVGWARQLTELTRAVLRGGPRFKEGGAVDPEVQASIGRRLERGEVGLSYLRTQATAVGLEGSFDTQTVSATLNYELLQDLTTNTALSYYRTSREGESADIYAASFGARYRMLEWLFLFATYNFNYQKGVFETERDTPRRDEDIYHNVVTVGIEATQPFRVY